MELGELISLKASHCELPCRFYFTYNGMEIDDICISSNPRIELINGEIHFLQEIEPVRINLDIETEMELIQSVKDKWVKILVIIVSLVALGWTVITYSASVNLP